MAKYKISFDYDFSEVEEHDDDAVVDINWFDTENFGTEFDSSDGIAEFEEWYNDGADNPIHFEDIMFDSDDETGYLDVTTDKDIDDLKSFAEEIVGYLFDGDSPRVSANFSGTGYVMDWSYTRDEPYERKTQFDYDEIFSITSYNNLKFEKVN